MLCPLSQARDSHTGFPTAKPRTDWIQASSGWGGGARWLLSWSLLPPSGHTEPTTPAEAPAWHPVGPPSPLSALGSHQVSSILCQAPWPHVQYMPHPFLRMSSARLPGGTRGFLEGESRNQAGCTGFSSAGLAEPRAPRLSLAGGRARCACPGGRLPPLHADCLGVSVQSSETTCRAETRRDGDEKEV